MDAVFSTRSPSPGETSPFVPARLNTRSRQALVHVLSYSYSSHDSEQNGYLISEYRVNYVGYGWERAVAGMGGEGGTHGVACHSRRELTSHPFNAELSPAGLHSTMVDTHTSW